MTVGMNFSRQTSDSDDSGPMERQNLQVATQTNFPVVATDSGSAETSSQAIGVRGALGRNQASPETQRREELSPMKQESNRFSSFVGGWPRHGTPDPRDLARAGIYYTGSLDSVQCVFSRGILRNWDEDDVPMDEHRRHFPMCPFVMGMDVGNIPDPSVIVSDNSSNSTVHITGTEAVVTDSVLGIVTERPKHPQYALESSRISSFTNWPSEKAQTPAELAKAGLFHTGSGDKVKCFLCDGGLCTWEQGDDPWMVHARWFPRCPYVRQVKGEDFIKQSMEEKRSTTSSGSRFRKGSTPSSDEAVHQTVSGENNANSGSSPTIPNLCQAALHMPPPQEDQARLNQQPQAGFYYTGTVDRVQCVFYRGILRNWDEDDVPMDEHRRHFPMCPFVMGMDVGNIPDPTAIIDANRIGDVASLSVIQPNAVVSDASLGIVTERPKHSQYAVEASRVSSFRNWPSGKEQTPQMLANAGFFYAGFGDSVKCFFCDGGLRTWERGDDPWVEHARWFPRCPYVRQVKGEDFIKQSMEGNVPSTMRATDNSSSNNVSRPAGQDAFPQKGSGENNANSGSSPSISKPSKVEVNLPPLQEEWARLNQQPQDIGTLSDRLRKENEEMKQFKLCKLCMERDRVLVFLPCGHLVMCEKCGPIFRQCPMCRGMIMGQIIAKFAPPP